MAQRNNPYDPTSDVPDAETKRKKRLIGNLIPGGPGSGTWGVRGLGRGGHYEVCPPCESPPEVACDSPRSPSEPSVLGCWNRLFARRPSPNRIRAI